jgi:hypothetical protein
MPGRRSCSLLIGLAATLLAGALTAHAAEVYLGAWKIASAAIAPWADPARKPDEAEMKSIVGKTVTFKPKEITGPRTLACKGPKYKLSDFSADMLFQGAFGEMHEKDRSLDPAKLAASVGFQGSSWKVLETGCETEVDWHFIDPTTLAIGLNDYVYLLKKQ